MFSRATAPRPPDLLIDLGTASTRIRSRGKGLLVDEPTVVATHRGARGREVVAVGTEAKAMLGRTPTGTQVVRPVIGGVVADFEATEELLRALIRQAVGRTVLRPRVAVCVPSTTSEVERRAVQDSARAAGAREVLLLPTAMCAAAGAGLPVTEAVGSAIVDVGAGRTEVAVVSLGGMVVYRSSVVAGDAFDEAIAAWLLQAADLLVGAGTAEAVKLQIGGVAGMDGPTLRTVIRGRDRYDGGPQELALTSDQLWHATAPIAAQVRDAVLEVLRETPPELAADIVDRGILVCGGGALLRGLPAMLREATGLPVLLADDPLHCVALGAERIASDPALLGRLVVG